MPKQCPECNADESKIHDKDCESCDGSGECGFCQGEEQDDCPYDCNNSVCTSCDGAGVEGDMVECIECGVSDQAHQFEIQTTLKEPRK
mgnify:FL=1